MFNLTFIRISDMTPQTCHLMSLIWKLRFNQGHSIDNCPVTRAT